MGDSIDDPPARLAGRSGDIAFAGLFTLANAVFLGVVAGTTWPLGGVLAALVLFVGVRLLYVRLEADASGVQITNILPRVRKYRWPDIRSISALKSTPGFSMWSAGFPGTVVQFELESGRFVKAFATVRVLTEGNEQLADQLWDIKDASALAQEDS